MIITHNKQQIVSNEVLTTFNNAVANAEVVKQYSKHAYNIMHKIIEVQFNVVKKEEYTDVSSYSYSSMQCTGCISNNICYNYMFFIREGSSSITIAFNTRKEWLTFKRMCKTQYRLNLR